MKTEFTLKKYLGNCFISIPYQIIQRADSLGASVIVNTPQGELEIKEIEYKQGLFCTRKEELGATEIKRILENIESRSAIYLLHEWSEKNQFNN